MQVAPKSPGLSLLASFFLPGLGSMINGEAGKGIAILVCWIFASWVLTVVLIGFIGLLGFWIWGMVDGYQGARKWNLAHGIIKRQREVATRPLGRWDLRGTGHRGGHARNRRTVVYSTNLEQLEKCVSASRAPDPRMPRCQSGPRLDPGEPRAAHHAPEGFSGSAARGCCTGSRCGSGTGRTRSGPSMAPWACMMM